MTRTHKATLRTIARTAGIVLGTTAGVAGAGMTALVRRPLPRTRGTLKIAGLHAPVTVIRDVWGVPHLYAKNEHDLFLAQGYVHAQDRLWQMEFQRRLGYGQLAELFGPIALGTDRFTRILGFGRVVRTEAEQLDGPVRDALSAYVAGVNQFIERNQRRLPIEFGLLRFQPRPWQITDVLVWSKMMALNLSGNWDMELLRARIVAAVGEERAAQLDPSYPDDHPLTVPPDIDYTPDVGEDALRLADDARPFTGNTPFGQGSNAWVVGGARSATGKPLLANDPHLGIQVPSLWYEMHLSSDDLQVTGASIPGSPGIVIGHNQQIAWGVTNGMTDVQDLYIERFSHDDPTMYEYNGQHHAADIFHEEIVVRGHSKPYVETVRVTRHGPVMAPCTPERREHGPVAKNQLPEPPSMDGGDVLALRWTALEPATVIQSIYHLNHATDWHSFRAALAQWDVPAQNFVYADTSGQFGYALGGKVPIRAAGHGKLPVPGWHDTYEWTGFVPPDELPHVLNPREGFAVTANNRIVGDTFTHRIDADWLSGFRASRIRERIQETSKHTADSFAAIQADVCSLPGQRLRTIAERCAPSTPLAEQARAIFLAWDGCMTTDSVGATIYARFRESLLDRAFAEIGEQLGLKAGLGAFSTIPGEGFLSRNFPRVLRAIEQNDASLLAPGDSWQGILDESWQQAIEAIRAHLGSDVQHWQYGRWHTITLRHPLGAAPTLSTLFDRGPYPIGGDLDTVCMGFLPRKYPANPYFVGPSYRHICDPSNWDNSRSIHPVGQSGQPGSRHYADFVLPWLDVRSHPMLWSRALVEESAEATMTLHPSA